ncbi:restriction endonuclease subunit S [Streptosporangium sp. NPDC000095]|uniref:restriction endonuclease subunit S n=1 Tax=Streptosporangium sp. NPDC000095 TaxID=3366184 RepID=UPI0036A8F870
MTDLPPGWEWTTLEDLLAAEPRAITDGPFGSKLASKHYTAHGARVIRLQNIGDGVFRDERAYISSEYFEELRAHEVQAGDLLLASLGEVLPRVCIVPDIGPAIVKADCIRARIHPDVDTRWVLYALMSPESRSHAASLIKGVGRPRLGLGAIKKLPIPLPPPAEQRRIAAAFESDVSHLDAGDKAIDQSMERAKALWQSVLNGVVGGRIAGRDAGFNVRAVGDVASVQGGIQKQQKRRPVKNKFPFLRVANVSRGGLDLNDVHEVELFYGEIERFKLDFGDLLVVEGNGSPDQVGRAAMWHGEIPDCVHQNHLIRVRPHSDLNPRYLELVWNAPATKTQLRKVASSTSGLHTLSTAKIKAIQIPVPPLDVQHSLLAEAQRWRSHLDVVEREMGDARQRSNALRRSLLKEAFVGRLLPQDPADEPASELLARIKAEQAQHSKTTRARRAKPKTSLAATRTEWPDAGRTPTTYEQGELL